MLSTLHVKNLALIKDVEITFRDGLNVLSGETGAGKSILLGSVNLALGCRADSDLIRTGTEEAFVELVFTLEDPVVEKSLEDFGIYPEDHAIIITRRIREGKSQSRINGETVTAKTLRAVSSRLLDIHGQHEHQSLLQEDNHLTVLDEFGRDRLKTEKEAFSAIYKAYREQKESLKDFPESPEEAAKRLDFLEFQLSEIEEGKVRIGEEASVSEELKRLEHQGQIEDAAGEIVEALGEETQDAVARAVRAAASLVHLDPGAKNLYDSLQDLESLLQDNASEADRFLGSVEKDDSRMNVLNDRLSEITKLKRKYGGSEEAILKTYDRLSKEFQALEAIDENRAKAEETLKKLQKELVAAGKVLHEKRCEIAAEFDELLTASLLDLNFPQIHFHTEVEETNRYTGKGADTVRFLISVNPGEALKPLANVASGGELSRIMLAIKTLTADSDAIHTLIFDEIDTGISGRTAAKVAAKMLALSKNHQVLCISHLPQIVAGAEHHYLIEKTFTDSETVSQIRELGEEDSVRELARLLGAGEETPAALENARDMKVKMRS